MGYKRADIYAVRYNRRSEMIPFSRFSLDMHIREWEEERDDEVLPHTLEISPVLDKYQNERDKR